MKGIILKDLYEKIFMKISAFLKTGFLTSQQFFSSSCLSRLCKRETYFP